MMKHWRSAATKKLASISGSFDSEPISIRNWKPFGSSTSLEESSSTSCRPRSSTIESLTTPTPMVIDVNDYKRLQKEWKSMPNKEKLFVQIFADILINEPLVQKALKIKDLDISDLKDNGSDQLQIHAKKVERFFESFFCQNTCFEDVLLVCHSMGVKHASFGITFTAIYWLAFKRSLVNNLATNSPNPVIWNKFISEIVKKIRIGFNEGILRRFSSESLGSQEDEPVQKDDSLCT